MSSYTALQSLSGDSESWDLQYGIELGGGHRRTCSFSGLFLQEQAGSMVFGVEVGVVRGKGGQHGLRQTRCSCFDRMVPVLPWPWFRSEESVFVESEN